MNMHKWQCKLSFTFISHVWMIVHGKHTVWILKFQEIVCSICSKDSFPTSTSFSEVMSGKNALGDVCFWFYGPFCFYTVIFILSSHYRNKIIFVIEKNRLIHSLPNFIFRKGLLKNHFVHNLINFCGVLHTV